MAKKAVKPQKSNSDAVDVDKLAAEQEQMTHAAELLFGKLARKEQLTDGELSLLRRVGPQVIRGVRKTELMYEDWLQRNVSRLRAVTRLQKQAGSGDDRQAAQAEAERAEAELAEVTPAIEGQIKKLQAQLVALQKVATEARAASDLREDAVKRLMEPRQWPSFVEDRVRQQKNADIGAFGREAIELRGRLKVYEDLPKLDVSTPTQHSSSRAQTGGKDLDTVKCYVESNPGLGRNEEDRLTKMFNCEIRRDGAIRSFRVGELKRDEWQKHLADIESKAVEVRKRLAELETLEAKATEEDARLRSYYVPA